MAWDWCLPEDKKKIIILLDGELHKSAQLLNVKVFIKYKELLKLS